MILRAVDGATCSRALVSVFTLVAGLRVERPLIRSATDFRARILLVLRLQVLLIARRGSRPGYVQCLLWREGPSSTRSLAPVCPLHLALRAEDDEHVCHSRRSRREVKSPFSSFAGSPWCVLRAAKASWTHDLEVHSTEPSSWPARTAVLEKGCRKGIDQTGRQCVRKRCGKINMPSLLPQSICPQSEAGRSGPCCCAVKLRGSPLSKSGARLLRLLARTV